MIKCVPFESDHLYNIELKDLYDNDPTLQHRHLQLGLAGPSTTLLCKKTDLVVAIVGFTTLWPGCGEVWTLMSRHVDKYMFSLLKVIKSGIVVYMKHLKYRRLQATCPMGMECRDRWFESLGFRFEGNLRSYGPDGSDYCMYARLA